MPDEMLVPFRPLRQRITYLSSITIASKLCQTHRRLDNCTAGLEEAL
jgi:hypothetical protein